MLTKFEIEVILNQIAQGIILYDYSENWFLSLNEDDQKLVLKLLWEIVYQSHPKEEENAEAIKQSCLKPMCTPCVLLQKGNTYHQIKKIIELPAYENKNSFRLLITLFTIADKRRRIKCGDLCSHWWHKDLSQYKII